MPDVERDAKGVAVVGTIEASHEPDPTAAAVSTACPNCSNDDGDDDRSDNLGDGEHLCCLACGHCWAPIGHTSERLDAIAVGCTACSPTPPPPPTEWPAGCTWRLWDSEVDGATYWVAAPNVFEALLALMSCLRDEGSEIEMIAIEPVPAKRAWKCVLRSDVPPYAQRMFDVIVAEAARPDAKPSVLGCSEWP